MNHYDTWIDVIQPISRSVSELEGQNSLVIFRLFELNKTLLWLQVNVASGFYRQAIRELRYVLDSMAQAYYLDVGHPESDRFCKLEILKEIERHAFGTRLIEQLELGTAQLDAKEQLKSLYSDLCKYVHSTYEELEPAIKKGRFDVRVLFTSDLELFAKCVELTNRTMDSVFFLALSRFPESALTIKNLPNTMDWLKEIKSELCLKYLEDV